MSDGHRTHPTGGPAIRLKHKQIAQRQLESPGRQNAAQLTIWSKALCYCTTIRTQCVPNSNTIITYYALLINQISTLVSFLQSVSSHFRANWPFIDHGNKIKLIELETDGLQCGDNLSFLFIN